MWDLSLQDDKAELRRVQNREQPELLVGSPPSDEFSSLLNTCAEVREISKLKKTVKLSHRSELVYKVTSCRSNVSLEFEKSRIERQNRVHEKANKMDHEFQRNC